MQQDFLAIPKEDIEARHEYMLLSVIKDRIDNTKKCELEWFQNIHSTKVVAET
jgi:hypothetical protein